MLFEEARLAKHQDSAGRKVFLGEAPSLQLPCIGNVKARRVDIVNRLPLDGIKRKIRNGVAQSLECDDVSTDRPVLYIGGVRSENRSGRRCCYLLDRFLWKKIAPAAVLKNGECEHDAV